MNRPDEFAGMPVFRHGDKVFLIKADNFKLENAFSAAQDMLDRFDYYLCPFHFIDEFEQWFEWHRRVYFDHCSIGMVTCDMVRDREKRNRFKLDRGLTFNTEFQFDMRIEETRGLVHLSAGGGRCHE